MAWSETWLPRLQTLCPQHRPSRRRGQPSVRTVSPHFHITQAFRRHLQRRLAVVKPSHRGKQKGSLPTFPRHGQANRWHRFQDKGASLEDSGPSALAAVARLVRHAHARRVADGWLRRFGNRTGSATSHDQKRIRRSRRGLWTRAHSRKGRVCKRQVQWPSGHGHGRPGPGPGSGPRHGQHQA